MRDIGEGTIRRIDWQELTPVVLLLRVFNTATGLRVLMLSMIGVLLTLAVGCLMTSGMDALDGKRPNSPRFVDLTESPEPATATASTVSAATNFLEPIIQYSTERPVLFRENPDLHLLRRFEKSILLPWRFFTKSGAGFFSVEPQSWGQRLYATGWFASVVFIWSFFGGLICRTVALRLTIDESESLHLLWKFMKTRGTAFLSSLTIVAVGILCCLVPIKLAGWLFAVPVLDTILALFFPLILLFGLFAMILLVGLWFGWPLLFSAVAVEGTDGFDAVSRMFSYVYQRPWHYIFYWIVSGVFGFFGFILLSIFINGLVYLTIQAGGFPPEALQSVFSTVDTPTPRSVVLLQTWCNLADFLLIAYAFAWFWTTGVAIYLLLRRSVDATPLLEVYRQGAAAEKPRSVPEIKLDEQGAPHVNEPRNEAD